ncbi:MAG TPA: transglycosylase family protein [Candidatus Dormibacteraeota bacterium]
MPRRSRGVVLGLATLIISPILAFVLASVTHPVAQTNANATAVSYVVPLTDPQMQEPRKGDPTAPPTATPAPPVVKPAATPRPKIAVSAGPPASPTSVIGIIEAAAARWGVSGSSMVSIARCESGLRTNAVNPSGPYLGLFQFLQSTFTANGGTNIWSAADQSNIAAKMLAHGQAHQWSCA